MMKTNQDMLKALMRKRGEMNLTTKKLAELTGVSQWTLSAMFKGERQFINENTNNKLCKWLFEQI